MEKVNFPYYTGIARDLLTFFPCASMELYLVPRLNDVIVTNLLLADISGSVSGDAPHLAELVTDRGNAFASVVAGYADRQAFASCRPVPQAGQSCIGGIHVAQMQDGLGTRWADEAIP